MVGKRRVAGRAHATRAWNEYLAHKEKMLKLLGPDDDDIPA